MLGGDARYQEFAERWGSSGFGTYANLLQAQADGALLTASDISPCCGMRGRQLEGFDMVCGSSLLPGLPAHLSTGTVQGERQDAEEVAGVQIPRLEVQFWQMALD